MDHDQIRLALAGYLDHSLELKEHAVVEEHLKTCSSCSALLIELREILDQARKLDKVHSPPWMTQKIMARVHEKIGKKERGSSWFFRRLPVPIETLGVALLVVTGFLVYWNMQPDDRIFERVPPQTQTTAPAAPEEKSPKNETAPRPAPGLQGATRGKAPDQVYSNRPVDAPDPQRQTPQAAQSGDMGDTGIRGTGTVRERSADTGAQVLGSSGKLLLIKIRARGTASRTGIEEAIKKSGGTVVDTDRQSEPWVMTVQIDESKHEALLNALRSFGRTEERILAIDGREGREILLNSPKAAVGC